MMLRLYNSLTKTTEPFKPLHPPMVGLYTCGPTVYDYAQIGNCRKYVMDDILKRVLIYEGYTVKHVQNITDVGHLVSDADEGEDKLEKGAKRTGKTVWEVAKFYEDVFHQDMKKLNNLPPDSTCRATEHIPEQIELIKRLVAKGYAYDTPEAVYFDITKFANYEQLFGQKLSEKAVAVRSEVEKGSHKKHPADFALWFKRVGRFVDHMMHWDSPWGDGFPGWHIECSAMSMKYLGVTIDIHTGGIDHLSVHHPNEIAQSEAATGKQFVRFWVHHAFLMVDGQKMSKSRGNFYRVVDIEERGFSPLDLRYLYLLTHYRKTLNFTWESLESARNARLNIKNQISKIKMTYQKSKRTDLSEHRFNTEFQDALQDDLNTSEAMAVVWDLIKSDVSPREKYELLMSFDEVLGLKLHEIKRSKDQKIKKIPDEIQVLVNKREQLRKEQKWKEADNVRDELLRKGYEVEDKPEGSVLKIHNT
ncbi:cysteine--tRNA ligase [Candidatus Roizmanbacteria bacterium]|nr:cysteine--tRNA ligase [Candidatus Roizmanbacteria bacterium]